MTYLFLLHELGIGAIIYYMTSKDRCCKRRIHLFSANVSEFAIENEIVARGAQIDSCFLAKEDKSEDIAILLKK